MNINQILHNFHVVVPDEANGQVTMTKDQLLNVMQVMQAIAVSQANAQVLGLQANYPGKPEVKSALRFAALRINDYTPITLY